MSDCSNSRMRPYNPAIYADMEEEIEILKRQRDEWKAKAMSATVKGTNYERYFGSPEKVCAAEIEYYYHHDTQQFASVVVRFGKYPENEYEFKSQEAFLTWLNQPVEGES